MERINVYRYFDDSLDKILEGWFDVDKALLIKEDTEWDGNNSVSVHTQDQSAHQCLYRTAGGRWVLHSWTQWQGSPSRYEFVSDAAAQQWLLRNGDDAIVAEHFGAVEEERGPGAPRIGKPINIRLGDDLQARVDAAAEERGKTRADTIRDLVASALAKGE